MMTKAMILAALAAAALAAPAQANLESRYDARSDRQSMRIDRGVSNGHINAQEAARLQAQQARIDTNQSRLAADGYSRRDHARISARQAKANRTIGRARFNRR